MRKLKLKELSDEELKNIRGGEVFDTELFMGFVAILAVIVAILKLYFAEEGKVNIGKDYGFEWSWVKFMI